MKEKLKQITFLELIKSVRKEPVLPSVVFADGKKYKRSDWKRLKIERPDSEIAK